MVKSAPSPSPTLEPKSELDASTCILRAEKVTVDFDGFKAVQDLDFALHMGEVHFLIGPNGAGKTTLLDVMCGRTRPASGRVLFKESRDLTRLQEHHISRLGVGRKFQAPSVFLSLTPRENLELAAQGPRGVWANLRQRAINNRVAELLELIGLSERADVISGEMSHGEKQWLEIGMLLAQEPDALLLDEPAAGMTDAETDKMGEMLHRIAEKHSILVVEHDMEFVRRFAHRVTVMHEGKVLCAGTMEEVQNDPQVIAVYLGRRGERD